MTLPSASANRFIALQGAYNVRDLGGYPAGTGQTRWGMLFRADALHHLSTDDQHLLRTRGIKTVIDLRHGAEVETQPNVFAEADDVRYHNIPIFRASVAGNASGQTPDLPSIYRYIVEECRAGVTEVLTTIADAETGGVLFHCTAGKDRTGIIAALLLDMAGVDAETIADDYALTTAAMTHIRPRLLERVREEGGSVEQMERLLSSHREDMLGFMAYLHERYGDAAQYAREIGLTDEHIARLRERLIASQAASHLI